MNRADITRLAREAGGSIYTSLHVDGSAFAFSIHRLEAFAASIESEIRKEIEVADSPLTEKEVTRLWGDLQARKIMEARAEHADQLGRLCSACEAGSLCLDNNGYNIFLRCNQCKNVPFTAAQPVDPDELTWCGCGDGYPIESFEAGVMSAIGKCSNCAAAQPDKPVEVQRVGLTDAEVDHISYTSEDGGLASACDLIAAVKKAETNGGALGAIVKYRKATRLSAIRDTEAAHGIRPASEGGAA